MRYMAAKTAREAAEALAAEKGVTRVLAGGTDVLVQMKSGLVEPDLLVDIKKIPGIADITAEAGGFRIGAAVANAALGEHAGVVALWPGVVEGANLIGSTQVQGRCTMVGNLCNASPAGDAVPGLAAANAVARIAGPDGEIVDPRRADLAQQHGDAVDEGLATDDADFRVTGGHVYHVLAAAEADLQPDRALIAKD